jgi:hypothetical protein
VTTIKTRDTDRSDRDTTAKPTKSAPGESDENEHVTTMRAMKTA